VASAESDGEDCEYFILDLVLDLRKPPSFLSRFMGLCVVGNSSCSAMVVVLCLYSVYVLLEFWNEVLINSAPVLLRSDFSTVLR
jgi:hypothetical protein